VFIWMLPMFHAYVAIILSGCCVCVAMVFEVFHVFFKCFRRMFQTYVVSVVSECFKSRSGVVSLSSPFCCLALVSSPHLLMCLASFSD